MEMYDYEENLKQQVIIWTLNSQIPPKFFIEHEADSSSSSMAAFEDPFTRNRDSRAVFFFTDVIYAR